MVNYSNGKIYKIVPTNGDDICYIGSTTKQYLSQRMDYHRSGYKVWKNGKGKFTYSYRLFEKYGLENCKIVLIENFPCNSKDELEKREGEYIKTLNCINKRGAGGISIMGMVGKVRENSDSHQMTQIEEDDESILSTDTTIVSVNYQSDNDDPLPRDKYLIHLRNEYMKYQHLYTGLDNRIKWDKNNSNVDFERYKTIFWKRMSYILTDIKDLYSKPIDG